MEINRLEDGSIVLTKKKISATYTLPRDGGLRESRDSYDPGVNRWFLQVNLSASVGMRGS